MFKKIVILITIFLTFTSAHSASAHQPIIVDDQTIQITDPEISRAFYDELNSVPQRYFIKSNKNFELYLNLLVPLNSNPNGRYSAKIYDLNNDLNLLATIDGTSLPWNIYYETFGRDYYYKGPEYDKNMPAGSYAIDVYSGDNQGKYTLAIGKIENFSIKNSFNVIGTLRDLKVNFFDTSPITLAFTIFGFIYLISILIITTFFVLTYKFILHKIKKHSSAFIKMTLSAKLIRSGIFIILITLGLYTWNPIILFLADFIFISTTLDIFSQTVIKSHT